MTGLAFSDATSPVGEVHRLLSIRTFLENASTRKSTHARADTHAHSEILLFPCYKSSMPIMAPSVS